MKTIYSFLFLLVCFSIHVNAQRYTQKPPEKTRILFLLDASGSMLGKWENGQLKINAARELLSDLVDSLKTNKNLELALRVYGHQYHRRFQNCTDSKLEVKFSAQNHEKIKFKLKNLVPQGTTPIAYSLEQAANDFPTDQNVRNVIIIITDGVESCDGDPCKVSLALQKKEIFLKPFVIGLGLNETYNANFSCLGKFYDATDIPSFKGALDDALKQTLEKTTVSVELIDHKNKVTVTDLNISFTNAITNQDVYDFVHYRDRYGSPDSVIIDPVRDYSLSVFSVPPVRLDQVIIKGGTHNVIRVKVPQGTLSFQMNRVSEYGREIPVIVRPKGKSTILNKQLFKNSYQYLAGNYDLEIFTFPKTIIKGYEVSAGKNNLIKLAQPGVVNFSLGSKGFGSLYQVINGKSEWVYNFPYDTDKWTSAIQPGDYKLVYRADYAKGSKFTKILRFTVVSGSTQTINVNQ